MHRLFGLALLLFAIIFSIFFVSGKTEKLTVQTWEKTDPYVANLLKKIKY